MTNVSALRMIATVGVASASTSAPSAGPTTIAACPIPARQAVARCSSSEGTSRAVVTATDGASTTLAAVAAAAISGASAIGRRVDATAASASISPARITAETISSRRRLQRSASTPPSGPSTTTGNTRAAVVAATQVAEPVRAYTNTSSATL